MALNGINAELERLRKAKQDLRTSIQNQGVPIADGASISEYSKAVDGISTVRSVADILPDDKGNVPLTIDNLNGLSDIKVVSTSTAEPGTPASVEVVKSGSVANLSFIIPKGDNGYTPRKGTDYWTETDKQSIVSEVLNNTSHRYVTKTISLTSWQTVSENVFTSSFTDAKIPADCKLDIALNTTDLLKLMDDGIGSIRADNDNGTVQIVCIGAKPTADITAQISFVKLQQA